MKTTLPYQDNTTLLEAFIAYQGTEKRPLVILCHAWGGRDQFIEEKAQQVAEWGYVGFALDMYGKGILGKSKAENAALKKPFLEDRKLLQRRLLKAWDAATKLPYVDKAKVAVVGFGFGGLCALDLARSGVPLKGTVSVYGHFDPPPKAITKPIQGKVLILHGSNDPIVKVEELKNLDSELQGVDWKAELYEHTLHAFMNPAVNEPEAGLQYHAESAKHAWNSIRKFLEEVFV
jgi:dienelactone hydrolase